MNTEILIIEDDPVIRKELQTVLEGNKYHTSVIEDFSDVTEQVRKINPHPEFFTGSDYLCYQLQYGYG